ncbi:EIN3-binding F-box protein 1 [Ananas comosus]|uniref:EIN3-binding F-box protein 1 n=1 Tax=Ananas comosus TaxID=4615 RepID=A0A199VR21_ANACO|nr:EIN3-binding F-box protein 1 [Ananas comosus]
MPRISSSPVISERRERKANEEEHQSDTVNYLPDECLFEIFRRLPGSKERTKSACVCKKWLFLLSGIRPSDAVQRKILPNLNADGVGDEEEDDEGEVDQSHSNSSRGGLGDLLIRGSNSYGNPTCGITDRGLSAVAHACPSLRILSMWNVPLVTDISLSEIAGGCPILEKLDLTQCPLISEKGLIAVARKCRNLTSLKVQSCANIHNEGLHAIGLCCQKLNCLIIKDCPRVGDLGVSSLMASASSSLQKVKLEGLNISDISCAFVGRHGKGVSDLTLSGLQNVSKSEIRITAKSLSLQNLNSITVTSCSGVTDLALESIGKCCPSLKHLPFHRSFHLSDSGLRAVTETSRTLESLQLEGCSRITLNSVSLSSLDTNTNYQSLASAKCSEIKDFDPSLHPSCTHLTSLTIHACPDLTSDSLALVANICPKLEHIDLSGLVGLTDNGLLPFIEGSGDRLVKVNLSYCVDLTDAAIEALVKAHGRTLKLLNLDGCKKLTDKSLVAISVSCSRLKELDMSRCQISDIGIAVLASARHLHLKVLTLRSCSQVTEKSFPLLCKMAHPLGVLNLVLQADCYPRD